MIQKNQESSDIPFLSLLFGKSPKEKEYNFIEEIKNIMQTLKEDLASDLIAGEYKIKEASNEIKKASEF